MKNCINCGTQIPIDSLFCPKCGAKQSVDEFVKPTPVANEEEGAPSFTESPDTAAGVTDKKTKKGKWVAAIVRNSVIMAVAILLLIGSFLPISSIKVKDIASIPGMSSMDDSNMEFSLNTFQYITLFFDSFADVEDIEDLEDLRDDINEIYEEFADFEDEDYEKLSSREKGLLNEAFYISTRVLVQLDENGPPASLIFCVIFGILNILFSVAFFVVALLNLLATISRLTAAFNTWALALLTSAPAIILATHYVGRIYISLGGISGIAGMSDMAIWSVICVLVAIVVVMVIRYIFSKMDTVRNIIARSTALVLSVVVLCLAFAPVFSASFRRESSRNVTVSHGADFFEELAISEDKSENIEDLHDMTKTERKTYFDNCMKVFSSMSKKEIQSSYGASVNAPILVDLLGSKFEIFALNLLSVTVLFFIFTVISVLLVFWQSLYFFATGKHVKLVVLISKICSAATAVISLILTIVVVAVANSAANNYIGASYNVSISAGVIMMVIFSVGAVFCPASLTKKAKKARPIKAERNCENFESFF